ncbi:hypothetical protein Tco_1262532 [Tanacetum coccineum]
MCWNATTGTRASNPNNPTTQVRSRPRVLASNVAQSAESDAGAWPHLKQVPAADDTLLWSVYYLQPVQEKPARRVKRCMYPVPIFTTRPLAEESGERALQQRALARLEGKTEERTAL